MRRLSEIEEKFLYRLGSTVTRLRRQRDFSQQELADTAGVSRRLVLHVDAGSTNARILSLHRLARALKVASGEYVTER